jgi:hypothetical protein
MLPRNGAQRRFWNLSGRSAEYPSKGSNYAWSIRLRL